MNMLFLIVAILEDRFPKKNTAASAVTEPSIKKI
jgi:hypothetical protein